MRCSWHQARSSACCGQRRRRTSWLWEGVTACSFKGGVHGRAGDLTTGKFTVARLAGGWLDR
ncbi:hypothetical protein GCM10009616_06640 [Microlunatus lacustris]